MRVINIKCFAEITRSSIEITDGLEKPPIKVLLVRHTAEDSIGFTLDPSHNGMETCKCAPAFVLVYLIQPYEKVIIRVIIELFH